MIEWNVPTNRFLRPIGTMTVRVGLPVRRYFACEPFWLTSTKPCRRKTLVTSSDDGRLGTLERQAFHPGVLDRRQLVGDRVLEVQLQRFAQVVDRFALGVAFAGDVDVEAPRYEP